MFFYQKIVIKFGTKSLCSKQEVLNQSVFNEVARQVSILQKNRIAVTIISSGAIQAGREALKNLKISDSLEKKELAGIGSRHLFNKWGKSFLKEKMEICQMLITHSNWQNEKEKLNIKKGILDCFNLPIIPIINENDIVSDEEIRWMEEGISENDKLARMVALLIQADGILFITQSGGVFDKDPREYKEAKLIDKIDIREVLGSNFNNNGIDLKTKEAAICSQEGIKRVSIAGMNCQDVLLKFASEQKVGTDFIKGS